MNIEWIKQEVNLVRVVVTTVAVLLLVIHLFTPFDKINSITLALVVMAVLPWLSSFVKEATFPGGWKVGFREIQKVVEEQDEKISKQKDEILAQREMIDKLVIFSMAWFIFDLLKGIFYAKENDTEYLFNQSHVDSLLFLRNNGYIGIQGIRGLTEGDNLVEKVEITPIGEYFVKLRTEL